MKKNRNILIVAIVLALAALFLIFNRSNKTLDEQISEFAVSDTASVSKIFLADKSDNKILLERQANGSWLLNGKYEAHVENLNQQPAGEGTRSKGCPQQHSETALDQICESGDLSAFIPH
jgi:hypothetical protein